MYRITDARAAVEALLIAASNPQITEAQAKALIQEAAQNATIAFGEFAWHELVQIAIKQLDERKLAPLVTMELQAMFSNAEIQE
jgi:hypothetical protein